jgi:hypothetical protein
MYVRPRVLNICARRKLEISKSPANKDLINDNKGISNTK